MLATRQVHLTWEVVKWLAILSLAAALAVVFAGTAGGAKGDADGVPAPARLPPGIQEWSKPMGDVQPLADDVMDLNMSVWKALEHHDAGNIDQAIAAWRQIELPCDTDHWRHLALGVAHLQTGDPGQAADALALAYKVEPDNAVVHYYLGILRLEQATRAEEWYDAVGPSDTRLVSWPLPKIAPNSKGMYEMAAVMELERAIELAPYADLDAPLVAANWDASYDLSMPVVPPTVHDLLEALGGDNFEAKAHNMLSYLYLERGCLEVAEQHMDQAADLDLPIVFGYSDLGQEYEASGRHGDAARAYAKAMAHGGGLALPGKKMIENLRKAIIDAW